MADSACASYQHLRNIVDRRAASRHPKPCPDIGYPILHVGPSTPLYIKCICCLLRCCPRGLGLGLAKMACLHHCPFITLSLNGSRSFLCVLLLSRITVTKVTVYLLLIFFDYASCDVSTVLLGRLHPGMSNYGLSLLLVAVTRERRYGPSRLRVNDDDDLGCSS